MPVVGECGGGGVGLRAIRVAETTTARTKRAVGNAVSGVDCDRGCDRNRVAMPRYFFSGAAAGAAAFASPTGSAPVCCTTQSPLASEPNKLLQMWLTSSGSALA